MSCFVLQRSGTYCVCGTDIDNGGDKRTKTCTNGNRSVNRGTLNKRINSRMVVKPQKLVETEVEEGETSTRTRRGCACADGELFVCVRVTHSLASIRHRYER